MLEIGVHQIDALGFGIWSRKGGGGMQHAHTHSDIEVNAVTKGRLSYFLAGRLVEVKAGETLIFWAGMPHQTKEETCQGIWMTLPLQWFLRWELPRSHRERMLAGEPMILRSAALTTSMERWLRDHEGGRRVDQRASFLEMEAAFLRFRWRRFQEEVEGGSGDLVMRTCEKVARLYRESLSVELLADELGYHPKYLLQAFRRSCGMTLWDYVTRLRVAHAQRLLVAGDWKAIDVAFECGFESVSAFYAAFKRLVGQTPRAYARERKELELS